MRRSFRDPLPGVLILLLAATLRLAAFPEALVGFDQTSILSGAAEIADGVALPLTGMKSSIGVMQPAATLYLAALPLLLVRRVIAIKAFFSALDVLAVALLYRATRRNWGPQAAWIAALLYAANPWVVEFNRWIWYQTLIPTFATVAWAALLEALAPRARRPQLWLAVGMVAATLMGLVHLVAALGTVLFFVLLILIALRRRWLRGLGAGLGLSVLVALPHLLHLVATRGADVAFLLEGGEGGGRWSPFTYRLAFELLGGREVLSTPRDPLWAASVHAPAALYWIAPGLLLLALVGLLWRRLRGTSPTTVQLLLAGWTLLTPALFLRAGFHLQHFYLLFLFPAPYVLVGSWAGTLETSDWKRWLRAGTSLAVIGVALWWSYLWAVRIGYEHQGLLRAPTRAWLMDVTAESAARYLEAHPGADFVVVSDFAGEDYSAFDWLPQFIRSERVRMSPAGEGLLLPASAACYLLGPGVEHSLLPPETVARPELATHAALPWPIYCAPAAPRLPESAATWENGLSLLDATVEGAWLPGGRLTLLYSWRYEGEASPPTQQFFNHLLVNGELVAQVDGRGFPTRYWRPGDRFQTTFTLHLPETLPQGEYELLTGLYTWPAQERILLEEGAPAHRVAEGGFP